MRTIRTKVYKFNELSKDIQQKVIENNYNINVDDSYWYESIIEDAKNIGLDITDFDFDSASFVRNISGKFLLSANEIAQNIFNQHGESCETYKTAASFMEQWQPVFNTYMETEEGESTLIDMEDSFLNSLLYDYKKILQTEHDYMTSSEAIKETIEANEYEFTSNGKMI